MTKSHPKKQVEDDENQTNPQDFHQHLHHHHFKAIFVMLGFTFAQFFFMGAIVEAGELTIKALLGCTNAIRLSHEQSNELVQNVQLTTAAENKLKDMAQYEYWAHQNPVSGKQPWDFVDEAGYNYETTGENLAYGFSDSQKICDAWEHSPKHLANIVEPTYQEIGFAVDKANLHKNEKEILVVQMFGSRNNFVPSSNGPNDAEVGASCPAPGSNGATQEATAKCLKNAAANDQQPSSQTEEIQGASTTKATSKNSTSDAVQSDESVHPKASLFKMVGLAGAAIMFIAMIITGTLSFKYQKNKKERAKANLYKNIATVCGILTALCILTFFLF